MPIKLKNTGERRVRRLQSFRKEMNVEQEAMRKEMEEKKKKMIQLEKEKETEIQDSLRKVEEQKLELRRLSGEIKKSVNTHKYIYIHVTVAPLSSVQFCLIRLRTIHVFYRNYN